MFAVVIRSSHSCSNLETQRRRGFRRENLGIWLIQERGDSTADVLLRIDRSLIHSPPFPLFVRVAGSGWYTVDSQSDASLYTIAFHTYIRARW